MPILVDLNQVMISNMMVQIGNHHNAEVDEGMIRHMVLNTLRFNRKKFKDQYGELVICADDKNYWRKGVFPYYKARRKEDRDKSELDWHAIFSALQTIKQELKDTFPYKVIQIETCEADDIIGTIVHEFGSPLNSGEPFLILSGDKDYVQLQKYGNVVQYDPTRKKWLKHSDPDQYLIEHIIKGDTGDGVPNILSADNSIITRTRQKPVTAKRMESLKDINSMSSEVARNYYRNRTMIDLSQTPQNLKDEILARYAEDNTNERRNLLNYFIQHRLKQLTEYLADF